MRVLYCCHADNYHVEKWVPAMEKAGLEVHILTLRPSRKLSTPQTIILPIFSRISWLDFFTLAPKIRETFINENCDVLFCSFGSTYGLSGFMSSIKPFFVQTWSRDIGADSSVNKKDSFISKWISQRICKAANGITTDGPHFKEYVLKNWPIIPSNKICSTWWGIDTSYWKTSAKRKNEIRLQFEIPEQATVFISPRGVFWYYRPVEILQAIKEIVRVNENVFFLLPTLNHDCSADVKAQLTQLQLNKNVLVFDSFLKTDDFRELLICSDFLISTPLFDGISEVIQEGMSLGVVPILNPIPANLILKRFGTKAFWTNSPQPSIIDLIDVLQKVIELKKNETNPLQEMINSNFEFVESYSSVETTSTSLSYFFENTIHTTSLLD